MSALANNYKISHGTARYELQKIEIIHLHGSLGKYGEEDPWYSPELTSAAMRRAMSSIKIVHEPIDDDPQFVQARKVLGKAKKVIFLGFGFLPKNIERLRLDVIPKNVAIDSSAYAMTDIQKKKNERLTGRMVRFGESGHKVLDFLRHQISLD